MNSKNKVYEVFGPIWCKTLPFLGQKHFFKYSRQSPLFPYSTVHSAKFEKRQKKDCILRRSCAKYLVQFGVKMSIFSASFFFFEEKRFTIVNVSYSHVKFQKHSYVDSEKTHTRFWAQLNMKKVLLRRQNFFQNIH